MSTETLAVTMRMAERSLIVLGGILAIYFGYRLFVLGIDKTQGEASAFGITLKNFGPGLFFAALGSYVLITSMKAAIQTGYQEPQVAVEQARTGQTSPVSFFFGIEDPHRQLERWSAKSFFIDTRGLLHKLDENAPPQELELLKNNLKNKLDSITMTREEYQRFMKLTNQVPLSKEEDKELAILEQKLFP